MQEWVKFNSMLVDHCLNCMGSNEIITVPLLTLAD